MDLLYECAPTHIYQSTCANQLFASQTGAGMQDNLPGSTAFIPHNRFVYITVTVLLLTLTVGILLPHSKKLFLTHFCSLNYWPKCVRSEHRHFVGTCT